MVIFSRKTLILFLLIISPVFVLPCSAQQNTGTHWKEALNKVAGPTEYITETDAPRLSGLIADIIKIALSLIGVVLIIFLLYAGYLWMGADGNEEKISKAKLIIMNSFIGLFLVICAYAITYFIIKKLYTATQEKENPPGFHIDGSDYSYF